MRLITILILVASHYYFNSSWDLAHERAYASSQREHELRHENGLSRKRAHDSLSSHGISLSEGATVSHVKAPDGGLLLRKNGYSDSLVNAPPAPDSEGVTFFNVFPENLKGVESSNVIPDGAIEFNHSNLLDHPMRPFDEKAELATQRPINDEAPPWIVPARTPLGDKASPATDDTIHIVSQLGSISLPVKQIRMSGEFSDATSDSFPSIVMLSHLNSLVSPQFELFGKNVPYSTYSNDEINFAAMQSIIDKRNLTFDGVNIDGIFGYDNPLAFAAGTKNNPGILSQAQTFHASDRDAFLLSQDPKIKGLCNANVFKFRQMSQLPSGARLLNAIWSYRRKRHPDGVLLKHKSCICVDGSQQHYGIDYWDTYAPVVHWSTVHMVLVLCLSPS